MRSRQVNFFLTPNDQAELLSKLDPAGQFIYVARRRKDSRIDILPTPAVRQMGKEALKIYIARADDLDAMSFDDIGTFSSIDVIRSPVIEFSRCFMGDQFIRDGRFYVVNSYFDRDGRVARKDEGFLTWAARLVSKTRRCLTKDPDSFFYFGAEALQLKSAGFKTPPI
ncbi:hypothetical protein SSBR45G_00090 [Bradyrhizobium sp. SSBR45G]|uniref:hypothetical protein n=1 Tax=unclassified Bradyrhizobium TaxID=2631580 RepID=UPI002342BA1C|nr:MULTISPECIES: hypothetical protein [unclassified Bradyrhizobium]GLH75101.1 hypothetical protein SSBR45G_00090 [Bradyrhizobium sp. SSBR45G]GLH83112.1 hypothetical protein SSBR45R_05720 [Bradyrhizobium sp. SSBR45R]